MADETNSNFSIRLSPTLFLDLHPKSQQGKDFINAANEAIRNVYQMLGLQDVTPEIELVEGAASRFLFTLVVDGRRIRGPLIEPSDVCGPARVLEFLSERLYEQRELIIPATVIESIYGCVHGGPRSVSLDNLHRFAALLARYGVDLHKGIERLTAKIHDDISERELEDLLEVLLSSLTENSVVIEVNPEIQLRHEVNEGDLDKEKELLSNVKERIHRRTGVVFPPLILRRIAELPPNRFRLRINQLKQLVKRSVTTSFADDIVAALSERSHLLLTTSSVDAALGALRQAFPMPVFNCIERFGSTAVTKILRNLLEEGVAILDLRTILGAMLEVNGALPPDLDESSICLPNETGWLFSGDNSGPLFQAAAYTDYVRRELRHQLCQDLVTDNQEIFIHRLSPAVETRLASSMTRPLSPQKEDALIAAIYDSFAGTWNHHVLVTSPGSRRRLRELIVRDFPHLPVLSEQELSEYVTPVEGPQVDAVLT